MSCDTYKIYKIYYDEGLVYVGRTSQKMQDRLRMHLTSNPYVKKLNIWEITKIECANCDSQADMFIYEIYYINKYKPRINKDDKAIDDFSHFIQLPELEFKEYNCDLIDKWKEKNIEYLIDTSPLEQVCFDDELFICE